MEPNSTTDPFQQEIIALFAAEAQEWIGQVETALHELEAGPPQFRCVKLFETIRNGVTNLGGSAATVERPDIEKLAFAMLPHLEAIEGQGRVSSAGQCAALRESLEHLATAIQRLIPSAIPAAAAGAQPSAAPAMEGRSAPAPAAAAASTTLTGPIIDALIELQQSRAESAETTRALVDSLVQLPAGGADRGVVTGDRAAIVRNLKELDALDAQLLADVQQRMPNIHKAFSSLKAGGAGAFASNGSLDGVLQDVVHLRDEAFAAGASSVMSFFKGLHSWLSLVARQQISVPAQRFDAVESRLNSALTVTQQWVDVGRMKKANVEQFLGK
jgi:chemotaxis protein histidine kinase CheA